MQGPKKILIVGEQSTGKTTIIRAFLQYQQQTLKEQKFAQQVQYQNSNCMASTNADGDTQNNYSNSGNNKSMIFESSSHNLAGENNGLQQISCDNQNLGQTQGNNSNLTASQVSTIDPSSRKPDVSSTNQKRHTIKQKQFTSLVGENTDFSLKILNIEGQKVRVQLWDQGANINPKTTFQPLYTRHVSGCIIIANTSNPSSIAKAAQWKEQFDKITKVKDEPSIPCTLFINHDVSVPSFDILRAEDSEQQQKTPRSRKESETFEEPSFLNACSKIDQNLHPLTPTRSSVDNTCSLKKIKTQLERTNKIQLSNTPVNHNKLLEFEKLAKKEKNCYFGIYHVSISDSQSVYDSFENFIQRVLEDENYAQRTFSVASNFFDQYTLKNSIISNTMNSDANLDEHINWSDDQQVYDYYQQKNNKQKNMRSVDPYGSCSQDFSFKLRPLKDRRYERNSRDGNNSCC